VHVNSVLDLLALHSIHIPSTVNTLLSEVSIFWLQIALTPYSI